MAQVASTPRSANLPPALQGDSDAETLTLVASLLSEDLRAAQDRQAAEQLQLEQALLDSAPQAAQAENGPPAAVEETDEVLSLRQQLDNIHTSLSRSAIPKIALNDRNLFADQTLARQTQAQLDAQRGKVEVDAEFAKAVQKADDDGFDSDAVGLKGAEGVLGAGKVQDLLTSTDTTGKLPPLQRPLSPVLKHVEAKSTTPTGSPPRSPPIAPNKGKGPMAGAPPPAAPAISTAPAPLKRSSPKNTFTCSICLDDCIPVADPYKASLAPSSSSLSAPFGLFFGPRSDKHVACLSCAGEYVQNKLQDAMAVKVFPILCHEAKCNYELTDGDAARIFGEAHLERWRAPHRQADFETNPQASCPSCHQGLCAKCMSPWHTGYSCEQYQSLPADARAPEDLSLFALAREQRWSRCPGCKVLVERSHGCAHIICELCKTEHCYTCGSGWVKRHKGDYGHCGRNPPCDLWRDEADLLRPEFRNAALLPPAALAAAAAAGGVAGVAAAPLVAPPPRQIFYDSDSDDDYSDDEPQQAAESTDEEEEDDEAQGYPPEVDSEREDYDDEEMYAPGVYIYEEGGELDEDIEGGQVEDDVEMEEEEESEADGAYAQPYSASEGDEEEDVEEGVYAESEVSSIPASDDEGEEAPAVYSDGEYDDSPVEDENEEEEEDQEDQEEQDEAVASDPGEGSAEGYSSGPTEAYEDEDEGEAEEDAAEDEVEASAGEASEGYESGGGGGYESGGYSDGAGDYDDSGGYSDDNGGGYSDNYDDGYYSD
ncbi:hypothetical protein JCM6882_008418 [Rhodosporidiobolus microsporus]